jgi:hypothetical protein
MFLFAIFSLSSLLFKGRKTAIDKHHTNMGTRRASLRPALFWAKYCTSQILGGMVVIAAVVLLQIEGKKKDPLLPLRSLREKLPPAANVTDKRSVNDQEQVV